MVTKFQYTQSLALNTQGDLTMRPMMALEIVLKDGKKVFPLALIDSGADQTMVNIQYAEKMGIDLSNSPVRPMNGIEGTGAKETYVAPFTLKFAKWNEELTVPACFIDSPSVNILIGQEGFFDVFRIKFEKDHNSFEISEKR
jgi:predicted aspartyl protease